MWQLMCNYYKNILQQKDFLAELFLQKLLTLLPTAPGSSWRIGLKPMSTSLHLSLRVCICCLWLLFLIAEVGVVF